LGGRFRLALAKVVSIDLCFKFKFGEDYCKDRNWLELLEINYLHDVWSILMTKFLNLAKIFVNNICMVNEKMRK